MAVYTQVTTAQASALLEQLQLGALVELKGISGGIENTNYFVTSERGAYVLTLFERLTAEHLPFYLHLMKHLAHAGIPVPDPQTDRLGQVLHQVAGKPASLATRLPGASVLAPTPAHCSAIGEVLARMHLAARDYQRQQPNLRGLDWWNQVAALVLPDLQRAQAELLGAELAYQNHVASSSAYAALPRGPVHADLFRDNVLFEGERVSGVFDFYFAGVDSWLFDLAVTLNDWCVHPHSAAHDAQRARALLAAYQSVRALTSAERQLLPAMARAGALRFWLSRLWDWHLPRDAHLLTPHDPAHFERVLRERVRAPLLPA